MPSHRPTFILEKRPKLTNVGESLKFGQEKRGTYQWTIQFGDLKSEVHKGSEFKMSKEENRSRESCIYDDHTFEDSPPATKKAKYQPRQPGRDLQWHALLQNFGTSGEEPGYKASYSPVTRRESEDFFIILCWHSLVPWLSPQKMGRERDPGNICEKSYGLTTLNLDQLPFFCWKAESRWRVRNPPPPNVTLRG